MLPEYAVAGTLALLALFFFVVRSAWASQRLPPDRSAAELPAALLGLGYTGLGVFALVTVAYPALYLLGRLDRLTGSVLQLRFPGDTAVQIAGIVLLAAGIVLEVWSFRAIRPGTLTMTGPYARVRHPMYTGYMLAFLGVFPLTLNLLALVSLLAVPAQVAVAGIEEAGLEGRFGASYRVYAARTGRFLPRLR